MLDDRPRENSAEGPLPTRVRCRPLGWMPGEMLVTVELSTGESPEPPNVLQLVRAHIEEILRKETLPVEPPPEREPELVLRDPERHRDLLYVPFTLRDTAPETLRRAVGAISREAGSQIAHNVTLGACTPNWFAGAQNSDAGSPASQPAPTEPFGRRIRYAPEVEELDLEREARRISRDHESVQVAVLDTAPARSELEWARSHFPNNHHLDELIKCLVPPIGKLDSLPLESAREMALRSLEADGSYAPIEVPVPYDARDHGVFVAGIVHATAPWVRIRLVRVLNNFGVGSLHALIVAMVGLLQSRQVGEKLVINLSLGMLPPLEQLAAIWFGLPIDGLPGCPENPRLQFMLEHPGLSKADLIHMVANKHESITKAVDALHGPVEQLMLALQANDCLVVAAAGNDSVYRGIPRRPRWNPRIPAVYASVLGVAADTIRPSVPAVYSNRGELPHETGADVATLGGDLASDGVHPTGGMISVYTAATFPPLLPPAPPTVNTSGWGEWAGTSFAAPIVTGIAANLWMTDPGASAASILAEINARVRAHTPLQPDLGVPGIPLRLTWLP